MAASPRFKLSFGPDRAPWKHQVDTFEWAKDRHQAAYFLTMGLGKTAIAANVLECHRKAKRIVLTLIVAPLSVVDSWEEELERCFPGTPVLNLTGYSAKLARLSALAKFEGPYVLLNYDQIRVLEDELAEYLAGHTPFAIVCDESTNIKNNKADRTKAICRLGGGAAYRYILTGTPAPQGPEDIFGQYLFLDPSVFGMSFVGFRAEYMRLGGYMGKQIVGIRPDRVEAYNEHLYSIAKRYTKEECLDMPPKVYITRKFALSDVEREAYDSMAKDWVLEMKQAKSALVATTGLTKSLRLGQICTGFIGHTENDKVTSLDMDVKTKLSVLKELIEELEGKFIVWCAWRKNVKDVLKLLEDMGVKAVDYYGETEDRRANELAFRNDPSVRGFVGTGASGGAGLNLQGPDVRSVIYFSQDYSVFKRQQSEDRAHRGGIKHTVTIFDLVAKKTVEESIVKALKQGVELQDYVLQDPSKFVKGEL